MASTYTTKARLVAAALRWFTKVNAGRDASEEEEALLDRCEQHKKAENAWRRMWDRARRENDKQPPQGPRGVFSL